jgi:tryptophan synthase alpha chain
MAHMVAFLRDRSRSLQVARGLAEGGCAYLELQFPFSDPTADGPDIQHACSAALAAGFTVDAGFQLAAEICRTVKVPVFLMSYANLLFTRGVRQFLASVAASGVRGVIVPDLRPDYDEGLFQAATEMKLAAVPVLSPSMRDERLKRVSALGAEYLYVTLRTGTTGRFTDVDGPGREFLSRVSETDGRSKILGGFGVSSREQVKAFSPLVHAVVVGSALVRVVAAGGDVKTGVRRKVEELAGC